jgi:hypothetical protein
MKKLFTLVSIIVLTAVQSSLNAQSGVVINEVSATNQIEFKNTGMSTVDISSYFLCDFPTYTQISNLTVVSGSTNLAPGALVVISGWNVDEADSELGLYSSPNYGSAAAIVSYVEWGSSGHTRASVAIAAGIWTANNFVPSFASGESIAYAGAGITAASWTVGEPTIGAENSGGCTAEGGSLSGGPFTFCVGDGVADMIMNGAITLNGNSGTNSAWVITDDQGVILDIPTNYSDVDFDAADPGTCLVWHLSFEDGLTGAEVGLNASGLEGCFDLSNSIEVFRNSPVGGTLEGGPFTFCVEDGIADMIMDGLITLTGNSGANSQWVVTDDQGNILGLPPTYSVVDFDDAGDGTCLVWHLSFEDGLTGAEVGQNASGLQGCFSLSNPIEVFRNSPVGGTLEGGPFTFCVGDGLMDMIMEGDISLSGNSGANSAWVVTDDQGVILGLPTSYSEVDFEDAESGTCLVWHLSFEDGLTGAEVGMNAADLSGCFSLSNSITVNRLTGEFCIITSVKNENSPEINLFPNPTSGLLRLTGDFETTQSAVTVQVYQTTGQLLESITLNNKSSLNETIDISNYAAGIYLINVISDNSLRTMKLFKQ